MDENGQIYQIRVLDGMAVPSWVVTLTVHTLGIWGLYVHVTYGTCNILKFFQLDNLFAQ